MGKDWKSVEIHARNMNIKDTSGKVTNGIRNMSLETGGKAIFVLKCKELAWQNCAYVLVFCGR